MYRILIIRILIALILIIGGGNCKMYAQSDLDITLQQLGISKEKLTDLSELDEIVIDEPNRAIVNITGIDVMPTSKYQDVQAWMEVFDCNGNYFKKRVIMHAQGNSSLAYVKKNFAVDICEDEWIGDATTDVTIGNWVSQDSYHFKAFYTDYFKGITEIGYKLFLQMQADRVPYWERQGVEGDSKARCVPDGFPCEVYLNGDFYGLFAWQLKKHRKNMNQTKDVAEHIHLDGDIREDFILGGTINWTKFEVRNPKKLYCVDTEEVSGYEYKKVSDEEKEEVLSSGNYTISSEKPSSLTNSQIEELYGDNPPTYLQYAKNGNIFKLQTVSGIQYKQYDGDHPKELIDESMPYYDSSNKDHVRTAQVKNYIIQLSQYYNEIKNLIDNGATTEEVRSAFEERFDLESWLDYYVHFIVTMNGDGSRKNWQWFTYNGTQWMVAPYDLDQTLGRGPNSIRKADLFINTNTLIPFDLLNTYYKDDYIARYKTLRENGVFTSDNLKALIDNWYYRFGENNYEREKVKWPDAPCYNDIKCNDNWIAFTDYEASEYYPLKEYSETTTYEIGDKCRLNYVIFEATGTTTGVYPCNKFAYQDGIDKIHTWMDVRFPYLDKRFDLTNNVQEMASYSLTISAAGWATICIPIDFTVPSGLTAYSITGFQDENDKTKLTKMEVTECLAYKPYLVKGSPGVYLLTGTMGDNPDPEADDYLKNGWMVGATNDIFVPQGCYVLQSQNGQLAFYSVPSDNYITMPAYKAYLKIPAYKQAEARAFYFDGGTEGINDVKFEICSGKAERIFTIDGRRIERLQRGVNVVKLSNGNVIKLFQQ